MDSTIIAATAAVLGSVTGAAATIGTTWITLRAQAVCLPQEPMSLLFAVSLFSP